MGTIKLNIQGFHQLRTGPEMDRLVLGAARDVANFLTAETGLPFVAEPSPGRNRARAVVVPDDPRAAIYSAQYPHVMVGGLMAARHVL